MTSLREKFRKYNAKMVRLLFLLYYSMITVYLKLRNNKGNYERVY